MNDLRPRGNSLAARDIAALVHPYTNLRTHETEGPVVMAKGRGIYVVDDNGKEYIEGLAGLWCASLGFNEPRLAEAAQRQMRDLPYYHIFAGKSHEPGIVLAEKLKELAPVPMSKVFFASSGSEANDTAIKILWYVSNAADKPKRKKIISREKAYHGVTIAAASLTKLPINQRDFDLPIFPVAYAETPHHYRGAEPGESEDAYSTRLAANLEKLILAEDPETICAMFAEPVMGAGGAIVPPAGYFPKIQKVLKKYGILLVADEVICGFGRTGNMWGSQTYDMQPDILTCAKALSSAYVPISAVMVSEPVFQAMQRQSDKIGSFGHGYTYSAHPVPAAVALETLKIYEERDIVGHVRRVAPRFQAALRALCRASAGRRGVRRGAHRRPPARQGQGDEDVLRARPGSRPAGRQGVRGGRADGARPVRQPGRRLPAAHHHRKRDRRALRAVPQGPRRRPCGGQGQGPAGLTGPGFRRCAGITTAISPTPPAA